MKPIIYLIEFPSGATYIGATVNFKDRCRTHLRHGRLGQAVNARMKAEFAKGQPPNITQLASGFDRDTLHDLERVLIAQEQPTLNVNADPTPIPSENGGRAKPIAGHPSIKAAALSLGVPYNTLKNRIRRHGSVG